MSRKWAKSRTRGRKLHSVEAQTSQTEDELRAIIDNAPVFLWSDLPDGYCDFLNQPWLTYFNLSLQEAQGAGWTTVLHPDDAAHHLESWLKSVSTGMPFESEARFRGPDGAYRWFLTRANPLRDKAGRIVKWYGTNTWVRLAQRIPVRIHITHVPPGVLISAGMTCTVVIKEGAGPKIGRGLKKVMTAIFGTPST